MTVISMLIVGLIVGALARLLVPGKDSMGILATILLGLGGSLVGGWIATLFGDGTGVGIIGATIGSVILLLVVRAVTGKKAHA